LEQKAFETSDVSIVLNRSMAKTVVALAFAAVIVLGPSCESGKDPPPPAGPLAAQGLPRKVEDVRKDSVPSTAAPAPEKAGGERKTTSASIADSALSQDLRDQLGAAAWIPEDASFFSASLHLKEQTDALLGSRAYQRILALPALQMALGQLRQHPLYRQFIEMSRSDPLLSEALAVASDAVTREIFVFADAKLVPFLQAVSYLYVNGLILGFKSGGRGPAAERAVTSGIIQAVLEEEKSLRFPPLMVGFRLADPARARSLGGELLKKLGSLLSVPIDEEEIGGSRYQTARFSGRMVPREIREDLTRDVASKEVPPELLEKLNAFLDSQTIALSVGLRDDYFVISLAPTTEHLGKLGKSGSLAASKAFAPIRRHLKQGTTSLSYLSPGLCSGQKIDGGAGMAALEKLLSALPAGSMPEDFALRLRNDARSFLEDINRSLPDPGPWTAVGFINRGLETYSFFPREPAGFDARKPLSILSKAGARPLIAVAWRSMPSRDEYGRLVHWVKVAYGYFEDYVVPRLKDPERADFQRFANLFIPALKELSATTESLLLPALDGGQWLIAADAEGILRALPGAPGPLSQPLKYPRPALVIEVNDTEKLVAAFGQYRETLNKLFEKAAGELRSARFEILPPVSRAHAGGMLYTYPFPAFPVPGFEPHALLAGKYAVLSLSPAQSKALVEPPPAAGPAGPPGPGLPENVVKLSSDAGYVSRIDLEALGRLIGEDAGTAINELGKLGVLPPDDVQFAAAHLVVFKEVLGALKTYSERVHEEDGILVDHSWLHVEDLAP
jgi:hypothetical protein